MSRRDDAITVLVGMLGNETVKNQDQINAAGKIFKTENIERKLIDRAIHTLEAIMNDEHAEPRDRVNAADKLKDLSTPRDETQRDIARVLAAMTSAELREVIDKAAETIPRNIQVYDSMLD